MSDRGRRRRTTTFPPRAAGSSRARPAPRIATWGGTTTGVPYRPASIPKLLRVTVAPSSSSGASERATAPARSRSTSARNAAGSRAPASRSTGTKSPSPVSAAIPRWTPRCRVRRPASSSNHALRAGDAAQPATTARMRRTVTSSPMGQSPTSASSVTVTGTTRARDSAIRSAMVLRTPRSVSSVADPAGSAVRRTGGAVPLACSAPRPACPAARPAGSAGRPSCSAPCPLRSPAPPVCPGVCPHCAARSTSATRIRPPGPVPATEARSTPSARAFARAAGIALIRSGPGGAGRSSGPADAECPVALTNGRRPFAPAEAGDPSDGPGGAGGLPEPPDAPGPAASTESATISTPPARPLPSTSNSTRGAPVAMVSPGRAQWRRTRPATGEGMSTTAFADSSATTG